jgi:uncharacterized protein
MNFDGAAQFILQKLENELPENLTYHNLAHTKEVYEAAIRIGKEEHITEEDMKLLEIAALFHDSGWTFSDTEHEMMSCELAMKYLPEYEFTPEQIEVVCKLIMATRLPWSPENHLQEIIVDADLDYLGTDRFFPRADALRQELISLGRLPENADWNKLQVKFLETHNYYTASSIKSRGLKKTENLEQLKKSL